MTSQPPLGWEPEKLCQEPISEFELKKYIGNLPMNLAIIPSLNNISKNESYGITIVSNIFNYGNVGYNEYIISIRYENDFLGTNDEHYEHRERIYDFTKFLEYITKRLYHPKYKNYYYLDLLTQFRILSNRIGCLGPHDNNNYIESAQDFARNYLITQLNSLYKEINELALPLFQTDNLDSKLIAAFYWLYFQTYLFTNATLLNIWPLERELYTSWSLIIEDEINIEEINSNINDLREEIELLYNRILKAINELKLIL